MSNAEEEEEGNLLRSVKTFYSRASFKSASQKEDEDSTTAPDKSAACEVISPARTKRRRIQSTRYTGFVTQTIKRNVLITPHQNSQNSTLEMELDEKQEQNLTVPLRGMVEIQEQLNSTDSLAVHKIENSAEKAANCSVREDDGADKSPAVDKTVRKCLNQVSSNVSKTKPPTPTKLKRKHALCAIFEDIWSEKKTEISEKPQINGFKQTFNDVFNKVPQRPAQNSEGSPKEHPTKTLLFPSMAPKVDLDQHTSSEEYFSLKVNNVKPIQVMSSSPKTLSMETDGCSPLDLLISGCQVREEAPRSVDLLPPSEKLNNFTSASWLYSAQAKCIAQSKLISIQLIIRKSVIPAAMQTEHRKKRRRRCRKRKVKSQVTDADDEHSDSRPSLSYSRSALTGPLKLMTLEDLWVQKEFYLRYLCNYYNLSSEGCKGWMISRLHQFILQSVGSSSLSKHKTWRLFRTPQHRDRSVSWVKLNAEFKVNDSSE